MIFLRIANLYPKHILIERYLFLLFLFISSCQWDGTIYLTEADSESPDSSGKTVNDEKFQDSDSQTDSDTDTDTGFEELDSSSSDTEWYKQDIIVIKVHPPVQLVENPANLCVFLLNTKSFDLNVNVTNIEHSVCHPYPLFEKGHPYYVNFTESDIRDETGTFYTMAILYVEGGGSPTTQPVPGMDFQGVSEFPVELAPGSGLIQGGDIFLEPIHN